MCVSPKINIELIDRHVSFIQSLELELKRGLRKKSREVVCHVCDMSVCTFQQLIVRYCYL